MLGQIMYVVTLIDQFAFNAVDIADRALSCDDSAESLGGGGLFCSCTH